MYKCKRWTRSSKFILQYKLLQKIKTMKFPNEFTKRCGPNSITIMLLLRTRPHSCVPPVLYSRIISQPVLFLFSYCTVHVLKVGGWGGGMSSELTISVEVYKLVKSEWRLQNRPHFSSIQTDWMGILFKVFEIIYIDQFSGRGGQPQPAALIHKRITFTYTPPQHTLQINS